MADIVIRLARRADFAAIETCAQQAFGKYVARIGRAPAPMVADFRRQIDEGLVRMAADKSDSLIGFTVFYPKAGNMHLENIAVCPDHQGKGVGKLLMACCETEARRLGCVAVELYTNLKMTENLMLYPKLGYRETDRRRDDGFDRVFFEKVLS